MDERDQLAEPGEPLFTVNRSVRVDGSGEGLVHNIPSEAVGLLELNEQDAVEIDIYQNGYVVRKK